MLVYQNSIRVFVNWSLMSDFGGEIIDQSNVDTAFVRALYENKCSISPEPLLSVC